MFPLPFCESLKLRQITGNNRNKRRPAHFLVESFSASAETSLNPVTGQESMLEIGRESNADEMLATAKCLEGIPGPRCCSSKMTSSSSRIAATSDSTMLTPSTTHICNCGPAPDIPVHSQGLALPAPKSVQSGSETRNPAPRRDLTASRATRLILRAANRPMSIRRLPQPTP